MFTKHFNKNQKLFMNWTTNNSVLQKTTLYYTTLYKMKWKPFWGDSNLCMRTKIRASSKLPSCKITTCNFT